MSSLFNDILTVLLPLHGEVVKQPNSFDAVPEMISSDKRFAGYFSGVCGAIDGTHIPVFVPFVDQAAWRNRKGWLSQNVFAACSLDLRFQFIHAGWEGSAHDALVLRDALAKGRFRPPPGRYYLADARFYNSDFMMTPYTKVRYHLKEWEESGQRPQNKEELFNRRHAELRNAVERIFGVLKHRFKILSKQVEYPVQTQINIVLITTALYNFIATYERIEDLDTEDQKEKDTSSSRPSKTYSSPTTLPLPANLKSESESMKARRDELAQRMWDDYIEYLAVKFNIPRPSHQSRT